MSKRSLLFLIVLILGSNLNAQQLKSAEDSLAYALGITIAQDLDKKSMLDVDMDVLLRGVNDYLEKKEGPIEPIMAQRLVAQAKKERAKLVDEKRKQEGAAFLAEMKARPEVFELSDGVLYEVLVEGTGPKPEKGGDVTIHYKGMLIDGTEFDSSYSRGNPNSFNLGRLVKGWQVALPEMPVGSTWRIYLPPEMAYGSRSAGALIKPYSTLVFDIELIGI